MAQSISVDGGSVLIGSPVEVSVQAEVAGSKATFHRVKLIILAALSSDGVTEEFVLSAPVADGEITRFDLSDVLCTIAGRYQFAPVSESVTYPYISYTLSAYDEYMVDGILNEKVGERVYGSTMYALMGAFTDAERYLTDGTKSVTRFTRKPITGEVCSQNENIVYPAVPTSELFIQSEISSGPTVNVLSLADTSGEVTVGDRKVFVDNQAKNRFEFQFVNGLGVVESISVEALESMESSGTTEMTTITAPSTFKGVNRMAVRKSARKTKYKLSTGCISPEWAEWWMTEFFGSDSFRRSLPVSCWMKIDGLWWPCAAVLDEDATVYDRASQSVVSIAFTAHLALDGTIRPRI